MNATRIGYARCSTSRPCWLQVVDPHVYLMDILRRVDQYLSRDVHQLTLRLWKAYFADNPLNRNPDSVKNARV